jgi:hypothetical protein
MEALAGAGRLGVQSVCYSPAPDAPHADHQVRPLAGREAFLGYLLDYSDYWTQGESLDDLKDHLADLYRDLTSGELPGIRKVDELVVP